MKTSRDSKPKELKNNRGRGGKSDRGGKTRGGLIQTHGLFSEGAGSIIVKTRASSSGGGGGGGSGIRDAIQLQKPTINKKDNIKIDFDNEQKLFDEAIPDDEDEDLDDKSTIGKSLPILLNNRKLNCILFY